MASTREGLHGKKDCKNPVHFERTKNCKIKKEFFSWKKNVTSCIIYSSWRVLETKRNQENSHKTLMPCSGMWNVISKMPRNRIFNHSIFLHVFVSCIKYPRSPVLKKFIHENRELKSFTRLSKNQLGPGSDDHSDVILLFPFGSSINLMSFIADSLRRNFAS